MSRGIKPCQQTRTRVVRSVETAQHLSPCSFLHVHEQIALQDVFPFLVLLRHVVREVLYILPMSSRRLPGRMQNATKHAIRSQIPHIPVSYVCRSRKTPERGGSKVGGELPIVSVDDPGLNTTPTCDHRNRRGEGQVGIATHALTQKAEGRPIVSNSIERFEKKDAVSAQSPQQKWVSNTRGRITDIFPAKDRTALYAVDIPHGVISRGHLPFAGFALDNVYTCG